MNTKEEIEWQTNGSIRFLPGTRPQWTNKAAAIKIAPGEHRRHGLHGSDILTRTCEKLINADIARYGLDKTLQKIKKNLLNRGIHIRDNATPNDIISSFRRWAFCNVNNLMPGNGYYNIAINELKQISEICKRKLNLKFFANGEMPNEVGFENYCNSCIALLEELTQDIRSKGKIKDIVVDIVKQVAIPMIQNSSSIAEIDKCLIFLRDTGKIDVAFSELKNSKRFNKRILKMDTQLKRSVVSEKGLLYNDFVILLGRVNKIKNS